MEKFVSLISNDMEILSQEEADFKKILMPGRSLLDFYENALIYRRAYAIILINERICQVSGSVGK